MDGTASDIDYLKAVYAKARKRYKPGKVRVLLLAEAPPCAVDRFFYFEDVKKQDSLFLEIMGVLYPEQKARYLASGRPTTGKQDLLEEFKADGYWLLDLYEAPTSIVPPDPSVVDSLPARLETLIDKSTPIIIIKTNVYDACYPVLEANGYTVINERLPFPGSGQQGVFREKFRRALEQCG